MANLRFSPGLLSSIRDFGSSLTEAPASRANTLTGAGVQPASLGGMLARNVGGLMGRDMRTPQEKLQEVMSQGMETPAQELKVLAEYAKLDPVRGIPLFQAAQKRIRGEKKTQVEQDEQRSAVATAVATKYKDREDVAELVSLAGGGLSFSDIEKVAEDDLDKDDIVVVGNRVVNKTTGEIIVDAPGVVTPKVVEVEVNGETRQHIINQQDGSLIKDLGVKPQDPEKLGVQAQIQLRNANSEYRTASSRATKANKLATDLEQLTQPISSGLKAGIEESIKNVTGGQDLVTLLRVRAQELRTSVAIANLPPGPASDRDVELVLSGTLDPNANPETLAEYARGIAKLAQMEANFHSDQASWINKYKDVGGYLDHVTVNQYDNKISYIDSLYSQKIPQGYSSFTDYMLALSKSSSLTPKETAVLSAFEAKHGEKISDMFKRRDDAKRRLVESNRDKF